MTRHPFDQLASDLGTLVAFPTVSNRPVDALASFVAQRFEDLGFRIERFRDPVQPGKYNVVASIGPAARDVLLAPERDAPVAAVAGFAGEFDVIDK